MIIKSKIKNYSFEMIDNIFEKREELFKPFKKGRLFYFIDENIYTIYKSKLERFIRDDFFLLIPAKEENKSYLNLANYYEAIIKAEFTRNDVLVTFGGGILQDVSGFIASTIFRGIQWVFFPTTLLAQADSCIGSKTSINFNNSKNLIGTFYPPDFIYIDNEFCRSLTPEYFNSGLGEIIKFHLMSDPERYELLKKYLASPDLRNSTYFRPVILSTLKIKKSYFEGDEFDTGRRNLLNYGHCFGHALESTSNFQVNHGEAVLVGMGFANLLSLKRGIMTEEKFIEFEELLKKCYPKIDFSKISVEILINYLKRDKKRIGKDLTLVLSKDIGKQFKFNDIRESEIKNTYKEFVEKYPST